MKIKQCSFIIAFCLVFFVPLVAYKTGIFKRNSFQNTIAFDVLHGLPLVEVKIQDQKLRLILDLGAHFSSLSQKAIAQVPLTKTAKKIRSMNGYGQSTEHEVLGASNVTVGNYFLPYLEFNTTHPSNEFEQDTPKVLTYGTIGRELFLDKVLFINRKKKLCIVDQAVIGKKANLKKYHSGDWIEADFNLSKELGISFFLITGSGTKELTLDTGSNISLINDITLPKSSIDTRALTKSLSLKLSNERFLGTVSFYPFNFSDTGLQGILGFDFFDQYMICLDFLNRKIFFKPYKQF